MSDIWFDIEFRVDSNVNRNRMFGSGFCALRCLFEKVVLAFDVGDFLLVQVLQ